VVASCNAHLDASAASPARTPEEFSEGHVPGAVNIPFFFRGPAGAGRGTQQLMQQQLQLQQQ
jgi:3-mercaptopyruvate sulfurtransferase SseA